MATPNDFDLHRIESFNSFICKSYGNDIVDYINNFYSAKVTGSNLTAEEYLELLNNDVIFKILCTTINQKTLNKIYFWIVFWSIWGIFALIGGSILILKLNLLSGLFS